MKSKVKLRKEFSNKTKQKSNTKDILKYTLKPLNPKYKHFKFIGFDIETYLDQNKTHQFYSGGLYFKESDEYWYYSIENHQHECEKLTKKNKTKYIFKGDKEKFIKDLLDWRIFSGNKYVIATSLGFDFSALYYNTKYWNMFETIFSSSKLLLAQIKIKAKSIKEQKKKSKNNKTIKYIDTLNYIPASVEVLGSILNIPKIEKPKFIGTKPKNREERKELLYYNMIDSKISCEFLYFLQNFSNKIGGEVKLTISSSALDLWRRKYLKPALDEVKNIRLEELEKEFDLGFYKINEYKIEKIKIEKFYSGIVKEEFFEGKDARDFIFKAFYGGRTEIYSSGYFSNKQLNKRIFYYDVNSLYPYVMRENYYPFPNSVLKIKSKDYNLLYKNILEKEGVSEVKVKVGGMKYPILPKKLDGKLCFMNGIFEGVYNHNELRYAINKGYEILEIKKQIIYTKVWRPFYFYVNELYNLRLKYQKLGSSFEKIVKLYLNSLFGKFSQRYVDDVQIIDLKKLSGSEQIKLMKDLSKLPFSEKFTVKNDKIIISDKRDSDSIFSFPILSSYTTSYARILMHKYIETYNAIYTDTDSIITFDEIKKTSSYLGDMKLECEIEEAYLIKPKMYMLKPIVKIKGKDYLIKCKGVVKPDYDDFLNLIKGQKIIRNKFSKIKESIRRGIDANTVYNIPKELHLNDNKRYWFDKDFNTSKIQDSIAFYFDEEDYNIKKELKKQRKQAEKEQKLYSQIKSSYDDYLRSDEFDDYAVGDDITKEEFLENEMFFEKNDL